MKKYLLPESGNFYKANLHCHSTISDGKWTPEEIKQNYMAEGYSVIAYTDHDVMIPHHELTDESFLALTGYEMEINEPKDPKNPRARKTCHLCYIAMDEKEPLQVCWHREKYVIGNGSSYADRVKFDESLPDYEREYTHECVNDMIKKGREGGFFVTYNHPVWSLESYPNYIRYEGMNAMEICNFGCIATGWPDYNPMVYDDMLRAGRRIFCIATDDNHNGSTPDSFGGFTVIKAKALEYEVITKALADGHFYASQGPEIHGLWMEDGNLHVTCSPAAEIYFNTAIRRADRVVAKDGEALTEAVFAVKPEYGYVRVTVVDHAGKPANTNAYFIDEMELAAE